MSEFEHYEALLMSIELSVSASMNFLAIVAMYLIAAFVAGKKLPRSVAAGTSVIYTMFLIPPFVGWFGNLRRGFDLGILAKTNFPDSALFSGSVLPFEAYVTLSSIPMFMGWLGSIYFMHSYIRKKQRVDSQI